MCAEIQISSSKMGKHKASSELFDYKHGTLSCNNKHLRGRGERIYNTNAIVFQSKTDIILVYNGLFGSTINRPIFCKQTVAASHLAFFLFSLAIEG